MLYCKFRVSWGFKVLILDEAPVTITFFLAWNYIETNDLKNVVYLDVPEVFLGITSRGEVPLNFEEEVFTYKVA